MKTPIEPREIRAGDLIREEYATPWSTDGGLPRSAIEYRATPDLKTIARDHASAWFLLDRPKPAVELPTEFTLGWVRQVVRNSADGDPVLGAWRVDADADDNLSPAAEGAVAWDLWDKDTYWNVTAFTPATAVPTEALDKLRGGNPSRHYLDKIRDFLAAVDEANS